MAKNPLKLCILSLALVLASIPPLAHGQGAADTSAAVRAGSLEGKVAERTLNNGLRVVVLPRPGAPVVTLQIAVKVGSVDEEAGATGMAHLLEHMLFKGTETIGTSDWEAEKPLLDEIEKVGVMLDGELQKRSGADPAEVERLSAELARLQQEHSRYVVKAEMDGIYSKNGAVGLNASTSSDLTNYFVSLPANRLELWAAVESDRMRTPVLREYYIERDVVKEERRQRRETQPGGVLYEALLSTAFKAHPYRNPVIGWPSDLDLLDIRETRRFYQAHYGPDNAVIVAVGDVEPEAFFALVRRYFGSIPARGSGFAPPTEEPAQTGPRRVEVYFDAEPRLAMAYHKPTLPNRDDYVMDVIDALLTGGRTSRLVRELVDRKKVLLSISTANGLPGARYDNLFAVFASPAPGVTPDEAFDAIRAEIAKLAAEPPSQEELDKVIAQLEADRVRSMVSAPGLARSLAYFEAIAGDWRYMEELPRVLAGVTPEEVSAAAARYFTPANETVAILRKPPEGGDEEVVQ